MVKKILYIRSGPYQVDSNAYNLQELGLAKALQEKNVQCDIMYYHKTKDFDQKIIKDGYEINVMWRKGIRLLRSGIYPKILKKEFLSIYDAVIVSEYSQVMAVLLCEIHPNVYIYNGSYYNLFSISFVEKIYDALFIKKINDNVKCIFCKTKMAKEYLESKGLKNCIVTGVGLDVEKFNEEDKVESETEILLSKMQGHKNILYVGRINKRKNIKIIVDAFNIIKEKGDFETQLIIIGKDEKGYWEECKRRFEEKSKHAVVYVPFMKNAQLKYIYPRADIFILPSLQEIFGMVLLEAMYFGVPVIASGSAGAKTLIEDGKCGYIIENFLPEEWAEKMSILLKNSALRDEMKKASSERINSQFMWNNIVDKMLDEINKDSAGSYK